MQSLHLPTKINSKGVYDKMGVPYSSYAPAQMGRSWSRCSLCVCRKIYSWSKREVRISIEVRREGETYEKSWFKFVNNTFEFIFSSPAVSSFVSDSSLDKLNFFGLAFRTNIVGVVEWDVVRIKVGDACTVA